jgi:O-antigen/teichoic acid export membrane protein
MLAIIQKAKWLLGGNIIFAFSQWLMLTLIAKICTSQELGEYSYAMSIVAPVFILTNLQLRPIFVADYNSDKHYDFGSFFSLRFYSNVFGFIVVMLWGIFTRIDSISIIAFVAFTKCLEGISDIIYSWYNALNKTQLITRSLTAKAIISVILLGAILGFSKTLIYGLIGLFIAYLAVMLFIDFKAINVKKQWLIWQPQVAKQIIIYALPLGFTVMLVSLQTNLPRYFIEKYDSIESVGVFTVFYYFVVIGGIAINSVCQYLSPHYAQSWHEASKRHFFKIFNMSYLIAGSFGLISFVITYFWGGELLNLVYGDKFNHELATLNIIILSGIFTYLSVVNGYMMTSLKILKVQVPMFLGLIAITFVSCFLLIPKYHLIGAAWVGLISSISQFLVGLSILLNKFRGHYETA